MNDVTIGGRYFVRWMLHAFYLIVDSMQQVWAFVSKPFVVDWDILGVPIYYEFGYSLLELMLFGGIFAYLTFIMIKFILDLIF